MVEVYADVACPFAHVGIHRFLAMRDELGRATPRLHIRAWPLELVNGKPLQGATLVPKVAALREEVAPDLFTGFAPARFPRTTLPTMAAELAAARVGLEVGEAFSLAVRAALFEDGADVSEPAVLARLRDAHGIPEPTAEDEAQVRRDLEQGRGRGVSGSPHFFGPGGDDFFCPSLDIEHPDGGVEVHFDADGLGAFTAAVFG